jgi:nitrogen regulatory protein PII
MIKVKKGTIFLFFCLLIIKFAYKNMIHQKKVEIIIESVKVNRIIFELEEIGVPGFTIVGNISGKGANGVLDHNCKAKVFENTYIFTVCDEELANKIVAYMRNVLQYFSGTCFVSDVQLPIIPNKS